MPSERNAVPPTDRCRECGRAVASETNFCPECGADLGDPSAPAYCPECGDRFCSNCGGARSGGESTATASGRSSGESRSPSGPTPPPRESDRAFRRRVQDHLDAGWEIERDDGDRVVLVDRGVGSVGVHVLLLFITGGVGNLLYGWWHYSKLAERRRLVRGDATPARAPSSREAGGRVETVSAYLLTGLLLLIGGWITAIRATSGSPPVALVGIAFALLSLGMVPAVQRRLDRRHGISTFGRRKTVDHRVIRPPESVDEPCVVCGERIERGLVRRRRDETVVAGFPVRTHSIRHNHYCVDCARREVFDGGSAGPDSTSEFQVGADSEPHADLDTDSDLDTDADADPAVESDADPAVERDR
ncbi:zinc ribbon domain-containing protein [Halorubrum lipolyticum]|uniref:DZANK-type domain-containing protein n=1 Tax=Halorubrum lipolyticum DSM 21995 TaxID=1227482 RepID=M0P145_9EURY|nr:zinc ribbon domain-containing protein [Halorubrum lipolyticum]EMA63882.1 hypothetical protein C469_01984 [Halorubrum lipolyticum DSM 21995]